MTLPSAPSIATGAARNAAGLAVAAAAPYPGARQSSRLLRLLFAVPIALLPNALHIPIGTGIAGLNLSNLLFLMLLVALLLGPRDDAPPLTRSGYLTVPLLALFLALMLAFINAQWQDLSNLQADLSDLKNAIFYPLFYFVYRRCRQDLRGTRQLIVLVMLVAAVAALTAVIQGIHFGLGAYDGSERATGPFGDISKANRAGVFYAMFLPMFAAVAVLSTRKSWRLAALAGCVLLAAAILFTYSRQSYLIAVVALLLLLMHRSVLAAVLAALLLVLSVNLFPASVVERVQETRQVDERGHTVIDNSTTSRLEIWKGGIQMWRDHPAGVGLRRFSDNLGKYSSHADRDAHNIFVLMLAECGPLGLAALLWVFWRLWKLARMLRQSAAPNDTEGRAVALGFALIVVSLALGNVYGSPFFDGLVMANFWILCGLLERYGALRALAAGATDPALATASEAATVRFPLAARVLPGAARIDDARRQ